LSLVSCIISATPNEDLAEIPREWRDVLHPRRHGVIAAEGVRQGPEPSPARARLGSAGKSLWPVNELVAERGHDWVGADLADGLADCSRRADLLLYSATTAEQLSRFMAGQRDWFREDRLDQFVTAYDAVGNAAAPLIARWLAQEWWSPEIRRGAFEVLTRIPTDEAFGLLLHLVVDRPDLAGGVLAALPVAAGGHRHRGLDQVPAEPLPPVAVPDGFPMVEEAAIPVPAAA
jgi:hypothetical protein